MMIMIMMMMMMMWKRFGNPNLDGGVGSPGVVMMMTVMMMMIMMMMMWKRFGKGVGWERRWLGKALAGKGGCDGFARRSCRARSPQGSRHKMLRFTTDSALRKCGAAAAGRALHGRKGRALVAGVRGGSGVGERGGSGHRAALHSIADDEDGARARMGGELRRGGGGWERVGWAGKGG